jgi:predicted DNA-binding protein
MCIVHPAAISTPMLGTALSKSIRTSVILPTEAHTRIQALAEANNVSAAWIIRAAVLQFLEEYGDQTQLPLRLPKTKKGINP